MDIYDEGRIASATTYRSGTDFNSILPKTLDPVPSKFRLEAPLQAVRKICARRERGSVWNQLMGSYS